MVKSGSLTSEDVLRSEVPWPAFQSAGIISKEATSTRDAMLRLYGQLASERERMKVFRRCSSAPTSQTLASAGCQCTNRLTTPVHAYF